MSNEKIKNDTTMLDQINKSERWFEERLIIDREMNFRMQEIFSDSSYIEWLSHFTIEHPKFKDCEWRHFPDKLSSEDYKKVNDLDLLFYIVDKYAKENYRYPITTNSGKFYKIKYNDVGFIIGIVGGIALGYICSRVEVDNEKDFIDFNNIIANKKCDDVEFIERQLKDLSKLIVTLHASGVPLESISVTVNNTLDSVKPEKDDAAIVKSLRI